MNDLLKRLRLPKLKHTLGAAVLGLALSVSGAISADAGTVSVVGDVNASNASNDPVYLNILGSSTNVLFSRNEEQQASTRALFNAQPGVNAIESNAVLDDALLATQDLLVITRFFNNALDYTAGELAAIANFVSGGGHLLMLTEASANNNAVLGTYNAVLSAIGSTISHNGGRKCVGFDTDASLESTPISSPANSFTVNCHNFLDGGQAVAMDSDGNVFLAFEDLDDVNQVPVPATLPLLIGSIGIFGVLRQRRRKS